MARIRLDISETMPTSKRPAVPHGLRSTFRQWAAEQGYPRDMAELALALLFGATKRWKNTGPTTSFSLLSAYSSYHRARPRCAGSDG